MKKEEIEKKLHSLDTETLNQLIQQVEIANNQAKLKSAIEYINKYSYNSIEEIISKLDEEEISILLKTSIQKMCDGLSTAKNAKIAYLEYKLNQLNSEKNNISKKTSFSREEVNLAKDYILKHLSIGQPVQIGEAKSDLAFYLNAPEKLITRCIRELKKEGRIFLNSTGLNSRWMIVEFANHQY